MDRQEFMEYIRENFNVDVTTLRLIDNEIKKVYL